jgi:hypothetical protein
LWGRREYHDDTHISTRTIASGTSIAAMRAWKTQTTMFCHPAQEPRVLCLTWRWLSSLSSWLTQAVQAPRPWQSRKQTNAITRRVPWAWGQGLQALPPIQQARQSLVALIRTTKHTNNNNKHKQQKNGKKQSCRDTYATRHALQLLDKPRIESPDQASDTIPSNKRTSTSDDNQKSHFFSTPKIKRMTATSSRVQSAKIFLDGFSQQVRLEGLTNVYHPQRRWQSPLG